METTKKDSLKVVRPQKVNLKDKKKGKNRELTKVMKTTRNAKAKTKSKPRINKTVICKSCTKFKTGKDVCTVGKNLKKNNARRTKNMNKVRKYLNAIILSTFSSLAPSCISYMT